jgi:hypothetical protein
MPSTITLELDGTVIVTVSAKVIGKIDHNTSRAIIEKSSLRGRIVFCSMDLRVSFHKQVSGGGLDHIRPDKCYLGTERNILVWLC